jgi:VWFA-related protein
VRIKRPPTAALLLIAAFVLAAAVTGQEKPEAEPPPIVVRVSSELVQVDAVVTDGKGHYVTDLTADDFEIVADGRKRAVTNFRYVTLDSTPPSPPPAATDTTAATAPRPPRGTRPVRSLAIVVDDLSLSFESTVRTRMMLNRLVDESLGPGDLVAVLRTGGGMGSLQQFTTDRRLLKAAIAGVTLNLSGRGKAREAVAASDTASRGDIDIPQASDPGGGAVAALIAEQATFARRTERQRQANLAVGTLSALESVIRALQPLPGRKSVLFISEGFISIDETGDSQRVRDELRHLVDSANRASTVIYSIDPSGLRPLGPGADFSPEAFSARQETGGMADMGMTAAQAQREVRAGITEMAQDTGGFTLFDSNDLETVRRVLDDQRGYYLLGYVPDASNAAVDKTKFYKIQVKVKPKGLSVRSRKGFFATEASFDDAAPAPGIVDALMSPFATVDVPVRLTALFSEDPARGALIRCLLHVDAQALTFQDAGEGRKNVVLEAAVAAIGPRGRIVQRASSTYTLSMGDEDAEAARKGGFVLTLDLPVKDDGPHQIRAAAKDTVSGHAGSASQFLEVPELQKGKLAVSGIVMSGASRKGAGPAPDLADDEWEDPDATPAVRRFRANSSVAYAFGVYNAQRSADDGKPQLAVYLNLYREGSRVQSMARATPAFSAPPGDAPVAVASALRLGSAVPAGSYTLEVVVADQLRKGKDGAAVQSIDFDVVN